MKKDYLKKLAALSVAAAMVFSMAACGNTGTGNNAGNASESSSAAAENTSKKDNKKLTKRISKEGHLIGNHTYSHPDMSKISDEESFKKELQSLESLYKETTGQELLKIYRPPQGKYCVSNLEMADKLGYKTIFWSLAYVDWYENKQPTKEEAFNKLLKRIHPGAIVLLHSTSKTNGDILDELLTKWEDMGYSFGEIKDLIS